MDTAFMASVTSVDTLSSLLAQAVNDGGDDMSDMFSADTSTRPDRITPTSHSGVGYEMLAAAIIEKACDDYKIAILVQDERQARSIERFFRSKYFTNISRINPQWLIVNLKEKYEKEREDGKRPVGRPRVEKLP